MGRNESEKKRGGERLLFGFAVRVEGPLNPAEDAPARLLYAGPRVLSPLVRRG